MDGILLIDKDINSTSRDVDNRIKKIFNTRSVGHLGTLDPFASGLLIVALGQGTKLLPFIEDNKKTYNATLVLGEKTDSGDLTGNIIEKKEIGIINIDKIKEALYSFKGKSFQIPPKYSAKHINGKRAYDLARSGKEFELQPMPIEIFNIELNSFNGINEINFNVEVSKGTYIRTLGEDIAKKLNTIGYLSTLRRLKIDNYDVLNAVKIDEVNESNIINLSDVLSYEKYNIPSSLENDVYNGKDIKVKLNSNMILLIDSKGRLAGIYKKISNDLYHCQRGFAYKD